MDPALGAVIARVGPCTIHRGRTRGSHFEHLASAIVSQQLSGKAASTIYGRFEMLFPNETPDPARLARLKDEQLRAVGLSRQKVAALQDLAAHVRADVLPLDRIERMEDEAIIEALTQVRGIGRWTAQMFLMFRLGRLDVWPDLDLGVQKGAARILRLRRHPDPKTTAKLGTRWAPYRSVAAWYCWRALELDAP
jgi:3-methyladenine DNA glycosylase/8-oxoguanine DNA glycosylase